MSQKNQWLEFEKVHDFLKKITPAQLPILAIDDESSIGKIIQKFAAKMDFENCSTITTGSEAIELIKNQEFSVIFLDLQLGPMNGLEVLKFIKKNFESKSKDARVIILTGLPTLESAIEAMQLGAFNYIQKPLKLEPFNQAFSEALDDFYNARREILITKYWQHHQSEDIYELRKQLDEKDKIIHDLQEEIDHLKQKN